MAQERGTIVSFKELFNDNGRITWDSRNGMMYAWEVEMKMGNGNTLVKAFTKNPNKFSVEEGIEVTFETDWSTKYGLPYAKRIKDVNSQYANRGGNNNQSSNQNSSSQPTSQSAPVVSKSTGISKEAIKRNTLNVTLDYLSRVIKEKSLKLNLVTIKSISDDFLTWVNTKDNKSIAIHSLNAAVKTYDINEGLKENDIDIKLSKDLITWGDLYYEYLNPTSNI